MKWMLLQDEYKPILNPWTLAHFSAGWLCGFLGMPAKMAIPLVILWEVVEQLVLVPLHICWPPELFLDSVVDVFVGLLGYFIGRFIHSKVKDKDWFKENIDIF